MKPPWPVGREDRPRLTPLQRRQERRARQQVEVVRVVGAAQVHEVVRRVGAAGERTGRHRRDPRPVPTAGHARRVPGAEVAGRRADPDAVLRQRLGGRGADALLERGLVVQRDVLGDHGDAGGGEQVERLDVVGERLAGGGEGKLRARRDVVDDLQHRGALVVVVGGLLEHLHVGRQLALGDRVGEVVDVAGDRADLLPGAGQPVRLRHVGAVQLARPRR